MTLSLRPGPGGGAGSYKYLPAAGLGRVPLLEALDASGGVDQLLLAGEERVAGGADLQAHLVLGGMGLEGVTARAVHGHHVQRGMHVFLHGRDPSLGSVVPREGSWVPRIR